ncbi:hypothetical protein HPB48_006196 [Haemaphysalis longicornis]|uniref:Glycosyltransferase family 92 protein n=1 Tax=Haemaphysalis longicornis TaxID=44386 RepID=A0A9J6FVH2_HAELO|nr:hypothetical protein HPB48_006196 [Haemaphysalis longicornis]
MRRRRRRRNSNLPHRDTYRKQPRHERRLILLTLGAAVVPAFYMHTPRAARYQGKQTTKGPITPLPDPGKGSCPSADELSVDRYMKTWNDKVETHLRAFRGVLKTESASWNTLTRDLHFFTAHLDEQRGSSVRIRLDSATAQVMCPLPKGWNDGDLAVTVRKASNLRNTPKFWINVTQAPKISKAKCCAVCVKPVYQSDLTPLKVAEFIGHYRVIGARHFFLYDQDMSEGLKALLARFQSVGIDVAVVPVQASLQ